MLTPKRMQVLRFIGAYMAENRYAPTLLEIATHLQVTKVTAHEHLGHLKDLGLIVDKSLPGAKQTRALFLTDQGRAVLGENPHPSNAGDGEAMFHFRRGVRAVADLVESGLLGKDGPPIGHPLRE